MSSAIVKLELLEQFSRIGKALASPGRLELLELLAQSERRVDTLAALTGMTVANTSQHLQLLRRVGLVVPRKDGLSVFYRLVGDDVVRLLSALTAVGENHLAEVKSVVRTYLDHKDDMEPVTADELLKRARSGLVTVLDVRPVEEFAAGHLPGAVNIPIGELAKRLAELPRGKEVVAYCRGPFCLMSYEAIRMLRKRGLKARRLQNGLPEWRAAGLPVKQD